MNQNVEKNLKSCIKRKISFNESTMVKFLITGTLALSLTACGGGGGGGSSSTPSQPMKPTETIEKEIKVHENVTPQEKQEIKEEIKNIKSISENHKKELEEKVEKIEKIGVSKIETGKDLVINEDIIVTDETQKMLPQAFSVPEKILAKAVGVLGYGIDIINNKKIEVSVTENEAIGIWGMGKGKIENNGDIIVSSREGATGILAEEMDVVNNGNIKSTSKFEGEERYFGINSKNANVTNHGKITVQGNKATGISATSNGDKKIYNDGEIIEVTGNGSTGIEGKDINIKNSGNIKVTGDLWSDGIFLKTLETNKKLSLENSGNIELRAKVDPSLEVKRNETELELTGLSVGIKKENIRDEENITHTRRIKVNLVAADIKNTGNIDIKTENNINTNGREIDLTGISSTNGNIENTGDIKISGKADEMIGIFLKDYKNTDKEFKLVNSGNINIENTSENSWNEGLGTVIDKRKIINPETEEEFKEVKSKISLENTGNIFVKGRNSVGIFSAGDTINKGNIEVQGEDVKGIFLINSIPNKMNKIVNEKDIIVKADLKDLKELDLNEPSDNTYNDVVGINAEIKKKYNKETHDVEIEKDLVGADIENKGNIKVSYIGPKFKKIDENHEYINYNKNIDLFDGINAENSNIKNTGLIEVDDMSNNFDISGIAAEYNYNTGKDFKVENTGKILVKNGNEKRGIAAYVENYESKNTVEKLGKIEVVNSGDIEVLGTNVDKGFGIETILRNESVLRKEGSIVKNEGNIKIADNGIGIKIRDIDVENSGNIIVNNGGVGIESSYDSKIINTKTGKISVNAEDSRYHIGAIGIESFTNSDVENYGEITIKSNISTEVYEGGNNEICGIKAYESNIKNSGNINIIGNNAAGIDGDNRMDGSPYQNSEYKITNEGTIKLQGNGITGIDAGSINIENTGKIELVSNDEWAVGIELSLNNNGDKEYLVENSGTITVKGKEVQGILGEESVKSINHEDGVIIIDGTDKKSAGMIAGDGSIAINKGTIKVLNRGYGMMAYGKNSIAKNDVTGKIIISDNGNGGMIAEECGKLENLGTIKISNENLAMLERETEDSIDKPYQDKDEIKPVEPSEPDVKPDVKPVEPTEPDVKPVEPSEPDVKPDVKPVEPSEPDVTPDVKPIEPTEPDIKPDVKPLEPSEPDVTPDVKPVEPSEPDKDLFVNDKSLSEGIDKENINIINKGDIDITGEDICGIHSLTTTPNKTTKIVNEKDIIVKGELKDLKDLKEIETTEDFHYPEDKYVVGINAEIEKKYDKRHDVEIEKDLVGADIENNGNIKVSYVGDKIKEYDENYQYINYNKNMFLSGIKANNSNVKNTGLIEVDSNGNNFSMSGIEAEYNYNTGKDFKVENTGKILVKNGRFNIGIDVDGGYEELKNKKDRELGKIEVINSGDIEITGDGRGIHCYLNERWDIPNQFQVGSTIKNQGNIKIDSGHGIEVRDIDVENSGNIIVNNGGVGIESSYDSKIINTKTGKISVNAEDSRYHIGAIGIESFTNSDVENYGEINIKNNISKDINPHDSYEIFGIKVLESNAKNIGSINITGDKAIGIHYENDTHRNSENKKVINEGKIKLHGNDIAGINGRDINIKNAGDIELISHDKVSGMRLKSVKPGKKLKIENTGKINLTGELAKNSDEISFVGISSHIDKDNHMDKDKNVKDRKIKANLVGADIINTSSISIKTQGDSNAEETYLAGISSQNGNVENRGNIEVFGNANEVVGIDIKDFANTDNEFKLVNSGKINIINTIKTNDTSEYTINTKGLSARVDQITCKNLENDKEFKKENSKMSIENTGDISIIGDNSAGIYTNYDTLNKGTILVKGNNAAGIDGDNRMDGSPYQNSEYKITNEGSIKLQGNGITGIDAGSINIENTGKIELVSNDKYAVGIELSLNNKRDKEYLVENSGTITVKGKEVQGILGEESVKSINHEDGVIIIDGTDKASYGMIAGDGSIAINKGTIKVLNRGYGMLASGENSIAKNDVTGKIIISDNGNGGMIAEEGGKLENLGTIKISNENLKMLERETEDSIDKPYQDKGEMIPLELEETKIKPKMKLRSALPMQAYVLSTDTFGNYGKLEKDGKLTIDEKINIKSDIVKNGFKDKYVLPKAFDADELEILEDEIKIDAADIYKGRIDDDGNIKLEKTNDLKDVVDDELGYVAELMQVQELSKTTQLNIKSKERIKESLVKLNPIVYANLGRQLLNTNERFENNDKMAIDSIGKNDFNVIMLSEARKIDNYKFIEGYDSKIGGFIGAAKLNNNLFATLGYSYNDIEYRHSGDGKIESIHASLLKQAKFNDVDMEFSLGGEYNFHKYNREIKFNEVNEKAKAKFNSYGARFTALASETFGENTYIKPFVKMDVAYMKHEKFTETNAGIWNASFKSNHYTSIMPRIGAEVGKKFDNNMNVFASLNYAYELGNMDRKEQFNFVNNENKNAKIFTKDSNKNSRTELSIGAGYNGEIINAQIKAGYEFGHRDNKFVSFGLGYKF